MLLASAVNVEKVDKVLPSLVERPQIRRQGGGSGEFLIIVLDLFLQPAKILDRFSLAGRERLDQLLACVAAGQEKPLLLAPLDQLPIPGQVRECEDVGALEDQGDEQRDHTSGISCGDRKTGQAPKIERFLDRFFRVARLEFC